MSDMSRHNDFDQHKYHGQLTKLSDQVYLRLKHFAFTIYKKL